MDKLKDTLVKLNKEQYRKIRAFAAVRGIAANKLICEIFDEWFKKHEGTIIR
jgi:hypothetical protein